MQVPKGNLARYWIHPMMGKCAAPCIPHAMIPVMKRTVGVMGASARQAPEIEDLAYRLGKAIGSLGVVLITGATTGMPLIAARGARESGGEVIGFSPAYNEHDHRRLGLPFEHHDLILYTGLGFHGRNLLNVRSSEALFFAGGSMGTLNEFTIAYDEDKIMGVLEGTGGFCDHMQDWIRALAKPNNRSVIHYGGDPAVLVDRVYRSLQSTSE